MRVPLVSWFFFSLYIATFFSMAALSVSGHCQSHQQQLLLGFKNSLDSSLSVKLVKWNQGTDCCSWDGISCDASGRVIGLDLSSQSISGEINNSNSLFRLQHLQQLNLAYNRFVSEFPSGFGNLTNLSYLNLSNAGFTGQIPVEISRLTSLITLDLSINSFVMLRSLKLENPNLKLHVQNLTMLRSLHLDGVNISARGNEWCKGLSPLTNLEVLSMSDCNLSGPIEDSLQNLKNLSVLHLDKNNLSAAVPKFLARLSNLTSLRLRSCSLHGTFPSEILQVRTLQSVDISDNKKLDGSLPVFHHDGSLRNLVLSRTNFSGSLPESIGNLVNLTKLDLSYCYFSGAIPSSISKLYQLVYLDLSFNIFTGGVTHFDLSKNLAYVDLSYNKLTGKIESFKWEGLQNLSHIDLSHNSFSGSIPSSLVALPLLKMVLLSNNRFGGEVPGFPKGRQSFLDTLDLSYNRLQGHIPAYIFELSRLHVLLLSSNKFNGTIWLGNIQKLVNLVQLDLSHNNLSVTATGSYSTVSSFPKISRLKLASCKLKVFPDLKNQSRLQFLDLSENQISGEVPNWIWNVSHELLHLNLSFNQLEGLQKPYQMPNLSVLDLHSNKLSGNIPTLPQFASYLDYSRNSFASSLPNNIGNYLSYTMFFSLSSNGLTGVIPKSICDASYLQVLDLSKNNLSGEIPKCLFGRKVNVGVLNLSGNNLRGKIPDAFPSNCSIQTLDVSGNVLQGKIPSSLANCKSLEVLNLGNNHINDIFPCHLKSIASLRILVLRSNEFHGNISCPANKVPWPKLQIMDIANNRFSGTLPYKCLKTWEAMMTDDDEARLNVGYLQFGFLQLSGHYYQDGITVTNKGLTMEFVKILTLFTSIDLSCNKFEGPIPEVIGELKALHFLNLSHNALTGKIPPSLGILTQLESLDLSNNNLTGSIPQQLVNLNFLAVLNFSYNQLEGSIPAVKQFATFSNDSYQGNKGLCGVPLTKKCNEANHCHDSVMLQPFSEASFKNNAGLCGLPTNSRTGNHVDWNFISVEIGFVSGIGAVIFPLMFCKRWRMRYYKRTDRVVYKFFPKLDPRNRNRRTISHWTPGRRL